MKNTGFRFWIADMQIRNAARKEKLMSKARISVYRKGVAAVALSAALAGAFVATGPLGTLQDARAEAVRVTPPQRCKRSRQGHAKG